MEGGREEGGTEVRERGRIEREVREGGRIRRIGRREGRSVGTEV